MLQFKNWTLGFEKSPDRVKTVFLVIVWIGDNCGINDDLKKNDVFVPWGFRPEISLE